MILGCVFVTPARTQKIHPAIGIYRFGVHRRCARWKIGIYQPDISKIKMYHSSFIITNLVAGAALNMVGFEFW